MKTYTITEQQLRDIGFALVLADYFCQDRELSEQLEIDKDTYERAVKAMKEVLA
jgi:hypothetical protein